MPKVGNKHFSYSPKGVKAAKSYAMKEKTEMETMKGSKPVKAKKK